MKLWVTFLIVMQLSNIPLFAQTPDTVSVRTIAISVNLQGDSSTSMLHERDIYIGIRPEGSKIASALRERSISIVVNPILFQLFPKDIFVNGNKTFTIVEDSTPLFSWDFQIPFGHGPQKAFQLQVSKDSNFAFPFLNSDTVFTPDTFFKLPSNSALNASGTFFIRIRVMDNSGLFSPFTESSFFFKFPIKLSLRKIAVAVNTRGNPATVMLSPSWPF